MKRARRPALIALVVALGTPWSAQANCKDFADAIEHAVKLIAMADAKSVGDNSAPRATRHELEISNHLARIEINLKLMEASKCALPKDPIGPADYMLDALQCGTAELKGDYKSPECDLSKWVRQPAPNPAPTPAPSPSP